MRKSYLTISIITLLLTISFLGSAWAVTPKITRHSTAADLLKGEAEGVVIDSEGTIKLGRESKEIDLGDVFDESWTVNSIVSGKDGSVYLGTSPNGKIIKYKSGVGSVIYDPKPEVAGEDPNDETFLNEHVFAMATDAGGRLLAAVSGDDCRLLRIDNGLVETLYEPADVTYILAVELDSMGNIYLGTGPEGKVYRLDPFGASAELLYDCEDKNILSLAVGTDGAVYAGSDGRGLVYKIDASKKTATVLFDSDQKEITSLLLNDNGDLYATATSALAASNQEKFNGVAAAITSGRPDSKPSDKPEKDSANTSIKIAEAKDKGDNKGKSPEAAERNKPPKSASHIYKIDERGFVTDIFSETAIFFAMAQENGKILLGTGNNAELFSIDTKNELKELAYENKDASQITALTVSRGNVYLGTANPAKLIELSTGLTTTGVYTSELVDAGQPAKWGKLQVEVDIPAGCRIEVASRSGNVAEPNDPTFSDWTEDVRVTEATQLTCPVGRFCQYRLTITTKDTTLTPVIKEIAIPHMVPNQAPRVLNVVAVRSKDTKKAGVMVVVSKTKDNNGDKLLYTIELRKTGRQRWIEIKDKLTSSSYEWNAKTVEDGEYEIRVTADDKLSNTPRTNLTGTRISDPFTVDNTAPVIGKEQVFVDAETATIKFKLVDSLSVIGKVLFTVDSDAEWSAALPDDLIADTKVENFTIVIEELEPGEHVVAVKVSDDLGNSAYRTFVVEIE
jgi:hypothetical protein